jgi:hypothetical protein
VLAARLSQRILNHGMHAIASRCMENPPLAEPEGDVVRAFGRAEEDEIACLQVGLL